MSSPVDLWLTVLLLLFFFPDQNHGKYFWLVRVSVYSLLGVTLFLFYFFYWGNSWSCFQEFHSHKSLNQPLLETRYCKAANAHFLCLIITSGHLLERMCCPPPTNPRSLALYLQLLCAWKKMRGIIFPLNKARNF